jgi:beta-lactamase superfamily II metal-dependent hydrolase
LNLIPVSVNYLAVLLAAVGAMVVGFLWYGPLFGKTWAKLSGVSADKMKGANWTLYLWQYVAAAVTALVLSVFLTLTGSTTLDAALRTAVWLWLGFQATLQLGKVLWEGKSWNLYFLDAGQNLVTLLVMAAVLVYASGVTAGAAY